MRTGPSGSRAPRTPSRPFRSPVQTNRASFSQQQIWLTKATMSGPQNNPVLQPAESGKPVAAGTANALLSTENLVKAYRGRRVVNGVSIHVNAGEIVGLLGPN